MKFEEIKVGQIVKHDNGFLAEVMYIKENIGNSKYSDIYLEVTDSGTSSRSVGEKYTALAEYCTLVKEVDTKVSTKNNIVINVEVKGLDGLREELTDVEDALMGVRDEVEALAGLKKEDTVFTAELGQGISFKGTKSDFEAFIKGMSHMMKIGMGGSL